MYIPKINELQDRDRILAFMQRYSFATIVTSVDGTPVATHLPFTIREEADTIVLSAHFARANPQWKSFNEQDVLVIFQGPHAYISPQHYEHTQNVPTWNYIAVHAYGKAHIVTDEAQGYAILEALMQQSEPAFLPQWATLSDQYREGLFKGIVPFEIRVTELQAKHKISQNKTVQERAQIISALENDADTAAKDTAAYMRQNEPYLEK